MILVIAAISLSACSVNNSSDERHGVNIIPIVQSNGNVTTVLLLLIGSFLNDEN